MPSAEPLPPSVEDCLARYLAQVAWARTPVLRGLYLVGSLALDDFRPGASDIDVVAVVDDPPDPPICEALERIHAAVREGGGPRLDGAYVTAALLRQPPRVYPVVPFSLDGRLRTGEPCREVNPVVWRCLARSGRTVLGPAPSGLGIADDEALFRAYQIDNLRGYWAGWIAQAEAALIAKGPGEDCDAGPLAWGVLGVARIACGLGTGRAASKRDGGRYALDNHPVRWHAPIALALSAHAGTPGRVPVESLRAALAYMRFVIDRCADAG